MIRHFAILPSYEYQGLGVGTPAGVEGVDWIEVFVEPEDDPFYEKRWSVSLNEWVIPYSDARVDIYRDEKTEINVSYDNGEEEYTVFNNERTRSALQQKMNRLQNTPTETVNFETVDGFFDLGLSDISGLFIACDDRQQACFNAAKATKAENSINPFDKMDSAKTFFDNQL